jgi:hypothetical protein
MEIGDSSTSSDSRPTGVRTMSTRLSLWLSALTVLAILPRPAGAG